MALPILNQRRGRVKTHGLIIEQAGVKFRGSMSFKIGGGVGQMREADSMGFGETIKSEGSDSGDDRLDDRWRMAFAFHGAAQFLFHHLHPFMRAMKA